MTEEVEMCAPDRAFAIGLMKLFGRQWKKPLPLALDISIDDYQKGRDHSREWDDRLWHGFERCSLKIMRLTHLLTFAPKQPSQFGLFVKVTKK